MRPPDDLRRARGTLAIAAVTAAAWILAWIAGGQEGAVALGGFVPAEALGGGNGPVPGPLTPLTATLVHSGFVHLFVGLIMLLFCGRSVEPVLGGRGIVILYLVGAYAGAAAQWAVDPASAVPMVGASSAVSAVLGAYALLFGRNKVKLANSALAILVNALWLGAAWIAFQILVGFTFETSGLRFPIAALAAGFVAGLALARPLLLLRWRGA